MTSTMDVPVLYPLSPPGVGPSGHLAWSPTQEHGYPTFDSSQSNGQFEIGRSDPRLMASSNEYGLAAASRYSHVTNGGPPMRAHGASSPVLQGHMSHMRAGMPGPLQHQPPGTSGAWPQFCPSQESFAVGQSPPLLGMPAPCGHEPHQPVSPYHVPQVGMSAKTKVCRYYLSRNNNHFGRSCSYVHPCRNTLITGACKHGKRCTDDHVCRAYVLYGESGPQGCHLGDACKLIHVKQEGDRAALIDMYRDWIAVKQHEVLATQALGSASAAASVVQTEVMLAAAVISPQTRISCPFFYSDTQAGCKAGPDCVYGHAGQFQLPTRPLPTDAQNTFAEKAWEKRRAQEAAASIATSPVMSVRTSRGSASTASTLSLHSIASSHIATPLVRSLSGSDSGLEIHALSLGDSDPAQARAALGKAHTAQVHSPAPDMSPLLHPSAVITQALQMATIISGPSYGAESSPKLSSASPAGRQASKLGAQSRHKRGTPPYRVEGGPAPGTLGADLLLPAPAGHSSLFPSSLAHETQLGLGLSRMRDAGTLQNALDGLTLQ